MSNEIPNRGPPPFLKSFGRRMQTVVIDRAASTSPSAPTPKIIDLTLDEDDGGAETLRNVSSPTLLSLLTYNLWFGPPHPQSRMEFLFSLIQSLDARPAFLAFQEITPILSYTLFPLLRSAGYEIHSQRYEGYGVGMAILRERIDVVRSGFLSFRSTVMDRGLCWAHGEINEGGRKVEVLFTSSHLESWIPGRDGVKERKEQLLESKHFCETYLKERPGIKVAIITGDLNWDDERKRSKGNDENMMEVMGGDWVDAWRSVKGEKEEGYTYDAKLNPMLGGALRRRFDRFLILFGEESNGEIMTAEMIGREAISGLEWKKEVKSYYGGNTQPPKIKVLPVTPSDHWGLTTSLQFGPSKIKTPLKPNRKRKK